MTTKRLAPDLDANWILGTLYQGGAPRPSKSLTSRVDAVVLAAWEYQPDWSPHHRRGVRVLRAPLDDDFNYMSADERKISLSAARKVRNMLDQGQTVLVTCHAGLNRSGLISGLALMLPSTGMSLTPGCLSSTQAIYAVQRARGDKALSNPQFVRMLERAECLCPSRNQRA